MSYFTKNQYNSTWLHLWPSGTKWVFMSQTWIFSYWWFFKVLFILILIVKSVFDYLLKQKSYLRSDAGNPRDAKMRKRQMKFVNVFFSKVLSYHCLIFMKFCTLIRGYMSKVFPKFHKIFENRKKKIKVDVEDFFSILTKNCWFWHKIFFFSPNKPLIWFY